MKNFRSFLRQYKLLSFAVITTLITLGLHLQGYNTAAKWIASGVALTEAGVLLYAMVEDVRAGSYRLDILAVISITTAVILGQYWAALAVIIVITSSSVLEDYIKHRLLRNYENLLKLAPKKANLVKNRTTAFVSIKNIRVGDKLIIKPGEMVPVDGIILEGLTSFDESYLNGELTNITKNIGEEILSGSINNGQQNVTVRATATAQDSRYEHVVKMLRSLPTADSPFSRLAQLYSFAFTIAALILALAIWLISGQAIRFLEVIIVASPYPLLAATALALLGGMSRAAKYGIIVKTGTALERLADAKTIVFEKTGILTSGNLEVLSITAFNKYSKEEVITIAASLAQSSSHSVAVAITKYANVRKISSAKAKHVKEIAGRGLMSSLHGKQIFIGHYSLLKEHNISVPAEFKQSLLTHTATFVVLDYKLVGIITFKDDLRADSKSTIAKLKQLGLRNTALLSGDSSLATKTVAKLLGIKNIHAEALASNKLHFIESITARPVVFIGDGLRDAPMLTISDVGIAFNGRRAASAGEAANIVLMRDDISLLAKAYALSKRTFGIAHQSIIIGTALSLVLMGLFATGKFSPLIGALLLAIIYIFVIVNSWRAARSKRR